VVFLLNPLGAAVLFTWIFNHTNGSVFIAMLLHASSDAAGGFFGSMFSGSDALMNSIWLAGAFISLAILLRVFAGRELGRKPGTAMDPIMVGEQATAK
jgi:uncharacterized membrane protein